MSYSLSDLWALELYQEEKTSTFTHWGKHYSLNAILALTEHEKPIELPMGELTHCLVHFTSQEDLRRVREADTTAPLLVVKGIRTGLYWVVDGNHRLLKMYEQGVKRVKVILVSPAMLKQALINKRQYNELYQE
jgi:hypothetical protein